MDQLSFRRLSWWEMPLRSLVRFSPFLWILSSLAQIPGDYQSPDLPPVLEFLDGREVTTADGWPARRAEILDLWQKFYLGHYPKEVPRLLNVEDVGDAEENDDGVHKRVRLTFDTPNKEAFEILLWIPIDVGRRAPLLLTQPRNYQLAWGEEAVNRGYIVCFYPGLDYNHHEDGFPGWQNVWQEFKQEYPDAKWASSLGIQAWLASRTLDYLLSDQCELPIHPDQIGIIGHSRYGKQSLYAAAFDPRIKAVCARSAGSPAVAGYRFTSRNTFMETVRDFPNEWALPTLKTFYGREDELPVESNGLLAAIAPRACLIHTAHNDGSDPTFAVERSYRSALEAYQLLGAPDALTLQYREGNHNPITDAHREINLDWFDAVFGRNDVELASFQSDLLHDFKWEEWRAEQGDIPTPPTSDASLRRRIQWMLGERSDEPKRAPLNILPEEEYGVAQWSRDRWKPERVTRLPISFGDNVHGNLMFSSEVKKPMPVVIWLHPLNYSHGYNEGYGVEDTTVYYRLAQAGYAVLCYDQVGFGDRLLEGADFYERHPQWSMLGQMVEDTIAAVNFVHGMDALAEGELPMLDHRNLFVMGYSLGGMVALHAAAMDSRITGVATHCGFTPWRKGTDDQPTGGNRRWWEWHALVPRLGLFQGREPQIPYDFDDLVRAISPRDIGLQFRAQDRHADPAALDALDLNHIEPWVDGTDQFQRQEQEQLMMAMSSWRLPDVAPLSDLTLDQPVPALSEGDPAPGKRVMIDHHALYLPENWKPKGNYPVLVEFTGNEYKSGTTVCTGKVKDAEFGYGISGGYDYLWLTLPYLDGKGEQPVTKWWGDPPTYDPTPTVEYCKRVVPKICEEFGGDPDRVVLIGFSRGALACNYIGLYDDEIAKLWRAFVPYSHYDGLRTWEYPESDQASARKRLARMNGRPQFICQESIRNGDLKPHTNLPMAG